MIYLDVWMKAKYFQDDRVIITEVEPGTIAGQGKFEYGDIITHVNGVPVKSTTATRVVNLFG